MSSQPQQYDALTPKRQKSKKIPTPQRANILPASYPACIETTRSTAPTADKPKSLHSRPITKDDMIIAVVGPTGAGKSSFINIAIGNFYSTVGHSLESCTQEVQSVSYPHPTIEGRNVVFVDTPGFDDTHRTDTDILMSIADWLKATYEQDITLTGVLYLHRISDNRIAGTPLRNLSIFRELCGTIALDNVILTTTMWDEVDEQTAASRMNELETRYWRSMIVAGSRVVRFEGTYASAWQIICMLTGDPKPLQIQVELVDQGKSLVETSAGSVLFQWFEKLAQQLREMIRRLEALLRGIPIGDSATVEIIEERAELDRQLSLASQQHLRLVSRTDGKRARLKTFISSTRRSRRAAVLASIEGLPDESQDSNLPGASSESRENSINLQTQEEHSRALVAVAVALGDAREIADIPPGAPFLKGVVRILTRVTASIENVKSTEKDLASLAQSAGLLTTAIEEQLKVGIVSTMMQRAVDNIVGELLKVRDVVRRVQSRDATSRYILEAADRRVLASCRDSINLARDIFTVRSVSSIDFAEESNCTPPTPSLTFSTPTLSSSSLNTNQTPSADHTGTNTCRVHPALHLQSATPYNVMYDPTSTNPSPAIPSEPATNPPLPQLIIKCRYLPWALTIYPSPPRRDAFVTVMDVLTGIYKLLYLTVIPQELPSVLAARQRVLDAHLERCRRIHETDPLRWVDFLMMNHYFLGLSATSEGPHVWQMTVALEGKAAHSHSAGFRAGVVTSSGQTVGSGKGVSNPTIDRSPAVEVAKGTSPFQSYYWLTAEGALQHLNKCTVDMAATFGHSGIGATQYAVFAGFHETFIRDGVGYLEEIHVITSAQVDVGSPLLAQLGKIFSPFPSVLFTASSSYRIPVFKPDGSLWDFDELAFYRTAKFADRGSNITSLSLVPGNLHSTQTTVSQEVPCDGAEGGSISREGDSSGSDEADGSSTGGGGQPSSGTGPEGRDTQDGGNGGRDSGVPPEPDPGDPKDPGEAEVAIPELSFEVDAGIYGQDDRSFSCPFQFIYMKGTLTLQAEPHCQKRKKFGTCKVAFKELEFGSQQTPRSTAYEQSHVRVIINSRDENTVISAIKPSRTTAMEKEVKVISATKTTWATILGATIGTKTAGTGSVTRTRESSSGTELKQFKSRITQLNWLGYVRWGFDIDDPYEREAGIKMINTSLPSAYFEFVGASDVPAPPPDYVDVEVASCWSLIPNDTHRLSWIESLLSSSLRTGSFSNLCPIIVMRVPIDFSDRTVYKAVVRVRLGSESGAIVRRPASESVIANPIVDFTSENFHQESLLPLPRPRLI